MIDQHVIEIKERLAKLEAKQDVLLDLMKSHSSQDAALKEEVDEIRQDLARGLAAVSLLKWLVGIGVAAAAAASRFFK